MNERVGNGKMMLGINEMIENMVYFHNCDEN